MSYKSRASQALVISRNPLTRKEKSIVMSGLRFVVKSKKKAESLGQQTQLPVRLSLGQVTRPCYHGLIG